MSDYGTCPQCGGMTKGVYTKSDFTPVVKHVCQPTEIHQRIVELKVERDMYYWNLKALQDSYLVMKAERNKLRDEMINLRDDLRPQAERVEGLFRHFYERVRDALKEEK